MLSVDDAIRSRRSVRCFKPDPVPRATVEHILDVASRAPSGTNMQPWHVHVLTGAAKRRLSDAILAAYRTEAESRPYSRLYYMETIREPYLARRRTVGWSLYGLLGIGKGERERTREFHARNYVFFGAPVGLIFTVEADLGWCSWLDFGMFIENTMLAARGQGLHSCPQAAFNPYGDIVRRELGLGLDREVICGMALGYEDETAPENRLRTERETVARFATFLED